MLSTSSVIADIHYVDVNCTSPRSPFLILTNAATTLQAAINVATNGDTVLVTNGVYYLTNTVSVSKGIIVRSASGPDLTVINGGATTRCVSINHTNALVNGFTITNGMLGGACISNGILRSCRIVGNITTADGGGGVMMAGSGMLQNCFVADNQAIKANAWGGGILFTGSGVKIENCTIVGNSAINGGWAGGVGSYIGGTISNSIIWGNTASTAPNIMGPSCSYSCSTPIPSGTGNTNADPLFANSTAGNYSLVSTSPCIDRAIRAPWMNDTRDMAGNPRIINGIVDIGCYESIGTQTLFALTTTSNPSTHGTPLPYGYTTEYYFPGKIVTNTVALMAEQTVTNRLVCRGWSGDGSVPGEGTTNSVIVTNQQDSILTWIWTPDHWLDIGCDPLGSVDVNDGWYTNGSMVTIFATASSGYVFSRWDGDVSPGQEGDNPLTVTMTQARGLTARFRVVEPSHYVNASNPSPDSPFSTWATAATNIQDVVDIASDGAVIVVTSGTYRIAGEIRITNGIHLISVSATNPPVVTANASGRCFHLSHPDAIVEGFVIANGSTNQGGGVYFAGAGKIRNCLIRDNNAMTGGGIYCNGGGEVHNCTIVGNSAGDSGGGIFADTGGSFVNTIIYSNMAPLNPEHDDTGGGMEFMFCCTYPAVSGIGNITNAPQFVDPINNDYRLAAVSYCANSGTNQTWMYAASDLYGRNRLIDEYVDMGASESAGTGSWSLFVGTTPERHGISSPYDYGQRSVPKGKTVTNTVSRNADEADGQRYACAGWTGTGSVPANGTTNVATFTIGTNSTLTWKWRIEYLLNIETNVGGTVNISDSWYTNGAALTIKATTNVGFQFAGWYGDIAVGTEAQNPLSITINQPRTLIAAFDPLTTNHHVIATSNRYAISPYCSWRTAATRIKDAVGTAAKGDVVLIGPGTHRLYDIPGRITVPDAITIRGVDGASNTVVDGRNGYTCFVFQTNGVLEGVTIVNGGWELQGGGVRALGDLTVRNCIFRDNKAKNLNSGTFAFGGGIYCLGTAIICDSEFSGNTAGTEESTAAYGGGIYLGQYSHGVISNCRFIANSTKENTGQGWGGGVYAYGTNTEIYSCAFISNTASGGGGIKVDGVQPLIIRDCSFEWNSAKWAGAMAILATGTIRQCRFLHNSATNSDGGAMRISGPMKIENCIICSNSAVRFGGGLWNASEVKIFNSILYYNAALNNTNAFNYASSNFTHCCATPLLIGLGNIVSGPQFNDTSIDDYSLKSTSPCINTGTNMEWMTNAFDYEGKNRILYGRVDMGTCEYVSATNDSDADDMPDDWEWRNGRNVTGVVAGVDIDGDSFVNLDEYIAGTDPANPQSGFAIEQVGCQSNPIVLSWPSHVGRVYSVEYLNDLMAGNWTNISIQTNVSGNECRMSYTNATTGSNSFYRVKVRIAP